MDQQKIGSFLKQLRLEHQLTQEKLAEAMCVTSRSVSRWENGVNLPDLPVLVQLADFYGVELREILNGERKPDSMSSSPNDNTPADAAEETARMAADYSSNYTECLTRRFHIMYMISIATMFVYMTLRWIDLSALPPVADIVLSFIQGACLGIWAGYADRWCHLHQQARQQDHRLQGTDAKTQILSFPRSASSHCRGEQISLKST